MASGQDRETNDMCIFGYRPGNNFFGRQANSVVRYVHAQTVATGSPLLLRGTRWPAQPASGLLHRSPPIEGTGETRLVLVLDPVTDPGDEVESHLTTPAAAPLH